MAGIRNSKNIAASRSARALDADSPLPGAGYALFAPNSANGCISEVSCDAIHSSEHDYNTAMKSYAVVYENYQSYLMPTEQLVEHDYDMAAKPVPDFSHLGCLNADLLDSTVLTDDVSDDDIENCGYMAWVRH
ncbi:MAG: hypothetical protein QM709_00620 [Spongiibacteraceae bacterium]